MGGRQYALAEQEGQLLKLVRELQQGRQRDARTHVNARLPNRNALSSGDGLSPLRYSQSRPFPTPFLPRWCRAVPCALSPQACHWQ